MTKDNTIYWIIGIILIVGAIYSSKNISFNPTKNLASIINLPAPSNWTQDPGTFTSGAASGSQGVGFMDYGIKKFSSSECEVLVFKDTNGDGSTCSPGTANPSDPCYKSTQTSDRVYYISSLSACSQDLPLQNKIYSGAFIGSNTPDQVTITSTAILNNIFPVSIAQQREFFEGLTNNIIVTINSAYDNPVRSTLYEQLVAESLSQTGASIFETNISSLVIINPGQNNYIFTIPTNYPIGAYAFFVTPLTTGNTMASVQAQSGQPLSYTHRLNFLISPKPLWIVKSATEQCISGYTNQVSLNGSISGTICVRSDIGLLACTNTGCPVTVNYTYACDSTGLCSEQIYRPLNCVSNSDCGTGQTCISELNVCVNSVLAGNLNSCSSTQPCTTFCQGVTSYCDTNSSIGKCVYSGQCAPLLTDCNTKGCPGGYICDTSSGLCKNIITIYQNETQTIYLNQTQPPPGGLIDNETIPYIILIILILGIIIYFVTRRK